MRPGAQPVVPRPRVERGSPAFQTGAFTGHATWASAPATGIEPAQSRLTTERPHQGSSQAWSGFVIDARPEIEIAKRAAEPVGVITGSRTRQAPGPQPGGAPPRLSREHHEVVDREGVEPSSPGNRPGALPVELTVRAVGAAGIEPA